MKRTVRFSLLIVLAAFVFCLVLVTGCAKPSYFGVKSKSIYAPMDFQQTEDAIAKAEQSEGAKACPEKIAQAKELARKGAEVYWACHTAEGLALLAEARKVAQEAEVCKWPEKPKEVIILKGVNFALDSAELTPASKAILDEQVKMLKENPGIRVRIAGHTCNLGTDEYNQDLSARRAKAVEDYFVAQGIAQGRLRSVGYGESQPTASNATVAGRSQNRRVELQIFD